MTCKKKSSKTTKKEKQTKPKSNKKIEALKEAQRINKILERNILENEAISRAGGEDKAENVMGEELFDKVEKKSKKKKE